MRHLIPATFLALALGGFPQTASTAQHVRSELPFPDLPGLITLRCDLHMHTVFSDGKVWPTVRAEEAWRDGLDAIAVTDHIEYQPFKADVTTNDARPYDLVRPHAESLGLLAIRGSEITRGEPPGHWNAIFLKNVPALRQNDHRDVVRTAFEQGGFIFWNHPGWKQPNWQSVWYAEQQEVLERGWLHGIEVVNGSTYDPIAHQWCLDKKLTIMSNSDIHDPIDMAYGPVHGTVRPMTLVFATARTPDALRQALFDRRTAVFSENRLIGEAKYLEPLFQQSIAILNPAIRIKGRNSVLVQVRNTAPIDYELVFTPKSSDLDLPGRATLPAGKVSLIQVRGLSDSASGRRVVPVPCQVTNLFAAPNAGLSTALRLDVEFQPAS